MAQVIDSFVVELGLDPSKFTKGQQQAFDAAKKLEDQQLASAKNIEQSSGKAADAIAGIRTQALSMLAVLTGGKGLLDFSMGLANADAKLGRLERNLGISASTISKWQGVARLMGGDAASMAQSFTTISDAFAGWKIGLVTPLIADLRAISTAGGKIIDVNKGVEQSFLDLAENLRAINAKDPAQAGLLGRRVGLDPALFDAMISGNLEKVLDYVKKIGVATRDDTDAFDELTKRVNQMGLKADSLGRKILGGENGGAKQIIEMADFFNMTPGDAAAKFFSKSSWSWVPGLGGTAEKLQPMFGAPTDSTSQNYRWRNAIGNIESRGNGGYAAMGPVTRSGDRAYGRYQVMGNNIGPWSETALGRRISAQEFMASPELQDKIFDHRFGSYVKRFGNADDAASAWFTGQPLAKGANSKDMLGTSGAEYVRRFNAEGGGGGGASTTTVQINGPISVTAPAGADAATFAERFAGAVKEQSFAAQANGGQN